MKQTVSSVTGLDGRLRDRLDAPTTSVHGSNIGALMIRIGFGLGCRGLF